MIDMLIICYPQREKRYYMTQPYIQYDTHTVFNQPQPLTKHNAYHSDQVLNYWVNHFHGSWANELLHQFGKKIGGELV